MDFEEKFIKNILKDCLKNCEYELKVLKRDTKKLQKCIKNKFERVPHKKVIDLLNKKFKMKLTYLDDIGAPEEEKLASTQSLSI